MAAKKKAAKKRPASGSAGMMNSNQRKQLEAIGMLKPAKKKSGK